MHKIAVDIGGTFTDVLLFDSGTKSTFSAKTLTTRPDLRQGLFSGIEEVLAQAGNGRSVALDKSIDVFVHGTTIATNAFLERKFGRCIVLATHGFEDVLDIGRHVRSDLNDLFFTKKFVFSDYVEVHGVAERMDARGKAIVDLTDAALEECLKGVDLRNFDSVAICFLNSYVNPQHELKAARFVLEQHPNLSVSCSYLVSPEPKEYERWATTAINALLQRECIRYIEDLEHTLVNEWDCRALLFNQSTGGLLPAEATKRMPVQLLLSGPTGGAQACQMIARALGIPNLVGIDMGGTSSDISIIDDGELRRLDTRSFDDVPIRIPMIDIHTVGLGGGSIVRSSESERITIGPASAGSQPGPICFDRGGRELTVTDLNLAAGRIDQKHYFNGQLALNKQAVLDQLRRMFPEESVGSVARKMLALLANNLATEIRRKLFEKGCDPRDFVLCSFGGAAGLHCCEAADELGIRRIVVPFNASVLSAYGILKGELVFDGTIALGNIDPKGLHNDFFRALAGRVYKRLSKEAERGGIELAEDDFEAFFNIGYRKQSDFIPVRIDGRTLLRSHKGKEYLSKRLIDDFTRLHRQFFGFAYEDGVGLQLVSAYCRFQGTHPGLPTLAAAAPDARRGSSRRQPSQRAKAAPAKAGSRRLVIEKGSPLNVSGPCFLETENSTIYVPAKWRARTDSEFVVLVRSGVAA